MNLHPHRRMLFRLGGAAAFGLTAPVARAKGAGTPLAPPPVEAYAAPPFVDHIALSPDGRRCALVTQKGDQKILAHFRTDAPDPQLIPLAASKIRGLFFGDNDHIVLTESTTTSLSEFAGNRQEIHLARTLNLETLDSHSSRGQVMDEAPLETEDWVVAPDGHIRGSSEFDAAQQEWRLRINTNPPEKRPHFELALKVRDFIDQPRLLGLGRDGTSLVVRLNGQYRDVDVDGVVGEPLDHGGGERQSDPLFHPVTGRLVGFARYDDWPDFDYEDSLLRKIEIGLKTVMGDDYRDYIVDRAEDVRKMIVYGENSQDAGTYYFVDLSNGNLTRLTDNYPDVPKAWISQKTAIRYDASDGLEIHGYLTLPPQADSLKNLPLVVLPHGGPQSRDDIGFDWQTQILASRGYAVLQPNFRGSSGYGDAFTAKGYGEWGRRMQTDLSDGVRWLAAQGTIDPKRVAILGASYGGYAALAGATLDAAVYRCAISVAGPSDLRSLIDFESESQGDSRSPAVRYWKQFIGDPKGYDAVSPAKQAAQAYCPILLIHGSDDTVVPIDQSRRMEKALKAAGKPVEFVTYKGQDHWETIGSARVEMMKSALAFLDKYNPA
ncbi:MAG: S9 family peptidase [Asticcacaulis sp.]|nr:S9 family peptidase [Asticcacaulis sp.]